MKSWHATAGRLALAFLGVLAASAIGCYLVRLADPSILDLAFRNAAPPAANPDGSAQQVEELGRLEWLLQLMLQAGLGCALDAFLWLPIVFFAYAVGRRRFSVVFVLTFATAEGIALGFASLFWAQR